MTTKLPVSPAVKLLTDARKLLEDNGWCRNVLEDENGRMCLYGALNRADHGHHWWQLAFMESGLNLTAEQALFRVTGTKGVIELVDWNNAPGRTKEDVLDALTDAVALLMGVNR